MIIAHYEHDIWAPGGMATYIYRVSQAQCDIGHTVYHFSKNKSNPPSNIFDNLIIINTEEELFRKAADLGVEILNLHRSINQIPPRSLPTVLTLHEHTPYCPSGSRYLKSKNCPCDRSYSFQGCLWGHLVDRCGSIRPHSLRDNFQRTWREMHILKHIPVIAVSKFLKEQMIRSNYPAHSIQVLPHFAPALDSSPLPLTQDTVPRFVYLGRLTPHKGVDWLIKTFKKVSVPCYLDIAGDGQEINNLKRLTTKLGLEERITFHGWVDSEKASKLIDTARAVIFPSLWHEPAGLVAFEAMAHARAAITSQVGGITEFIQHEINGLTVEAGNIKQLAKSIERLATDWKLSQKLGITGREIVVQDYSLTNHLDKLLKTYVDVANQNVS